jgi:hypothetical protein
MKQAISAPSEHRRPAQYIHGSLMEGKTPPAEHQTALAELLLQSKKCFPHSTNCSCRARNAFAEHQMLLAGHKPAIEERKARMPQTEHRQPTTRGTGAQLLREEL